MNLSTEVKSLIIDLLGQGSFVKQSNYFGDNYKRSNPPEEDIEGGGGRVCFTTYIGDDTGLLRDEEYAIKLISLHLQDDYEDISTTTMSVGDTEGFITFLGYMQEAVLQSDVFSHPNIVKVHDKWMQQAADAEESVGADDFFDVIDYLSKPQPEPLTDIERKALTTIKELDLTIYLAMDRYSHNLGEWLALEHSLCKQSIDERLKIIENIANALTYIHQKNYMHLDLKPENILLKQTFTSGDDLTVTDICIADFGLALFMPGGRIERGRGSVPYNLAPDAHYTAGFDIWSLGIIIYQLFNFSEVSVHELIELVKKAKKDDVAAVDPSHPLYICVEELWTSLPSGGDADAGFPERQLQEYMQKHCIHVLNCLNKDVTERPSAAELVKSFAITYDDQE